MPSLAFGTANIRQIYLSANLFKFFFFFLHSVFILLCGRYADENNLLNSQVMDIALLSKMIGEMVSYHSEVGLPGLGTFVVEDMPAVFTDRGYTINPPYKNISFVPDCRDDSAIVGYYADCNHISIDSSRAILTDYLSQLKALLKEKKAVAFPGLGRLRSTADDRIFFIPDENLTIFQDGLPLEPISLKNHVESDEEINIAVKNLSSILLSKSEPVEKLEPDSEQKPEPESMSEEPILEKPKHGSKGILYVFLVILVLLVVAFSAFLVLVEVAPEFVDTILYTPEELEIINW